MTGTITGLTPGTRYRVQAKLNTTLAATHVQPANQYCSQGVLNVAGQETSVALSSGQWRTATVSFIASGATASINIGARSPSSGSLCFLVVSIDANSLEPEEPNISISKTLTNEGGILSGYAEPGELLAYRIRLDNSGAAGNVNIRDVLDPNVIFVSASDGGVHSGGQVNWTSLAIGQGQTRDLTVTVRVADTFPPGVTQIQNLAYESDEPQPSCQGPHCSVIPAAGTATASKSLTGESGLIPNIAEAGETLTYTVTLINNDPRPAVFNLTDNIDNNTHYVAGSTRGSASAGEPTGSDPLRWSNIVVPAGGSRTVVYDVRVNDLIPAGVSSIGNVAYRTGDPEPNCAADPSRCTDIDTEGRVEASKELTNEDGALDGYAEAGEMLTYTVTLTNNDSKPGSYRLRDNIDNLTQYVPGSASVDGVPQDPSGSDPLAWDIVVPANSAVEVVYSVKVADEIPAGVSSLGNAAYKQGETLDCDANPSAPGCEDVPTEGKVTQNKQLTGEDGLIDGVAEAGETLTYTVTLTNNEARPSSYNLTDDLDPLTRYVPGSARIDGAPYEPTGSSQLHWHDIHVPANSTVQVVYSVKVADQIPAGVRTLRNAAYEGNAPNCDANPTAPGCSEVPTEGHVTKAKELMSEDGLIDGYAEASETLTYRVTLTNSDPEPSAYHLRDNIDDNTTYVVGSATVDGAPQEPAGSDPLMWDGIIVPANTSVEVVYSVKVAPRIPAGVSEIRNAAFDQGESDPDCDAGVDNCHIIPTEGLVTADKQLTGEDGAIDGHAESGETLTYTVTLTNSDAKPGSYRLRDRIDPNTTYVAGSATVNGTSQEPSGSNPLAWDILVPANGVVSVVYAVKVADELPPDVTTIGNVAYRDGDPRDCDANPTAPECHEVPTEGKVSQDKQLTGEDGLIDGVAEAGETLTYTVTLTNNDPRPSSYNLTDDIDDLTQYVPGSAVIAGAAREPAGSDPLLWNDIAVPANGTVTVVYSLKVADQIPPGVTSIKNVAYEGNEDNAPDCEANPAAPGCNDTPAEGYVEKAKEIADEDGLIDGVAEVGETLTYKVTLTNSGQQPSAYHLRDNIDDHTTYVAGSATVGGTPQEPTGSDPLAWDDILVPANGSVEVVYSVKVADQLPAETTEIRNIAFDRGEPEPDCDASPAAPNCHILPAEGDVVADKQLTGEDGVLDGFAEMGETLTYTVTLINNDPQPAAYHLRDNIDDNTSYVAGSAIVDGTPREPEGSDPLVWDDIIVPASSRVDVVYSVKVADRLPADATEIRNIAFSRHGPEPDCEATPTPPNCHTIPAEGRVAESKQLTGEDGTLDGYAETGETLTYTVTLTNNDRQPGIFHLQDDIDDHTVYVAGSARIDGVAREPQGSDPLLWDNITVPANSTVTVVYSVKVADQLPAGVTEIRNIAYMKEGPKPDCDAGPAPGCVPLPVEGRVNTVKKVTGESGDVPYVAEPGETITYTVTLTNDDPHPASYDLRDNIDDNTTYVTGSARIDGVAREPEGSDPLAWDRIVVPAGETVSVVYSVKVADPLPESVAMIRNVAFDFGEPEPNCDALPRPENCEEIPTIASLGKITIIKTADLPAVKRGEQIPFTIRVKNNSGARIGGLTVVDTYPSGFRYVEGSAHLNEATVTPAIEGRQIRFEDLMLQPLEEITIRLRLQALSTAGPGKYTNYVHVNDPTGNRLTGGSAEFEILADAVFDCGEIVGKVFDDLNGNGYQDAGEPGLPGVRVATAKGWLITTDRHGRFHVACADLPNAQIGSNFIMKLDTRTLPTGYQLTTENPRVVRLTAGKMTEIAFGASIGRIVQLDLMPEAFVPGSVELSQSWAAGIDQLLNVLSKQHSILQVVYRSTHNDRAFEEQRLKAIKKIISDKWRQRRSAYPLNIQTRIENSH